MTAKADKRRWRYVSVANELLEIIEELVEARVGGFRSSAHFVDEAIKEHLKRFGRYPPKLKIGTAQTNF